MPFRVEDVLVSFPEIAEGAARKKCIEHFSLQNIVSGSNLAAFFTDEPEIGENVWWRDLLVWILRLALMSLGISGTIAVRRRLAR